VSKDETPALARVLDGLYVLVVEDHEDSRTLLATVLAMNGAQVIAVASVVEALDAFERTTFDVVISDINMPDLDGFDLIERLRVRSPDEGGAVPAIAVTALDGDDDRRRLLAAGFQYHLAKPVEAVRLLELLLRASGRSG
jgi:CheY-like chemotaxis protein